MICQKKIVNRYLIELEKQNKIVITMLKNESGLSMLNKNIKNIIRYKHKSDIITYYEICKKAEAKSKQRKCINALYKVLHIDENHPLG